MRPDQRCNIYNCDDELVEVRVITLGTWDVLLKTAVKGYDFKNVAPIVREFLGAADDYPVKDLYEHIHKSYTDVMTQLREAGVVN